MGVKGGTTFGILLGLCTLSSFVETAPTSEKAASGPSIALPPKPVYTAENENGINGNSSTEELIGIPLIAATHRSGSGGGQQNNNMAMLPLLMSMMNNNGGGGGAGGGGRQDGGGGGGAGGGGGGNNAAMMAMVSRKHFFRGQRTHWAEAGNGTSYTFPSLVVFL
ncbi:hypothetical protein RvY_12886 [Ramazzottius varieornatus]|uniref:Uncharacterized protein n=1 Tax=Ramazzottius varieornatus TaxID=947166 RepID=A0A1D1VRE2_RAMVA|nr:hypothetical protein RvY_12886 [Ramazzottius varieornatus]